MINVRSMDDIRKLHKEIGLELTSLPEKNLLGASNKEDRRELEQMRYDLTNIIELGGLPELTRPRSDTLASWLSGESDILDIYLEV